MWWCEVDGNAGMGDGCGVVGCGECRACGWYTRFRYCVADVLWMSVVRGMRGVGGV